MYSEKLPSGNIRYVERYADPVTGRQKRVTVTLKPTGKRADRRLAEDLLQTKIKEAMSVSGNSDMITFGDLAKRRVEWQKTHHKAGTVAESTNFMHTLCRLIGEDTLVRSLTAAFVADHLSAPSPTTYNERLKHFKSLIRWGYRMDLVKDITYLDKLLKDKEPPVREKDKYKYLEHDEINALLDHMCVTRWRLLTQFLILSGLRIGEAIALNDDDVDLPHRTIRVTKNYSLNACQVCSTKTETSDREVFIQDELYDCCRKIRQLHRIEEMKYGFRSGLFFSDINSGSYIRYPAYLKYFRENCSAAIGRRLSVHSLRHTHTAMLAEAGIPLETISRRLGHADSKVTREVYMHVTEKMKERENEMLRNVKIC